MSDFYKKGELAKFDPMDVYGEDEERDGHKVIASGFAATGSARISTQQAAEKFAKPSTYTGNRKLFDDGKAKVQAKKEVFAKEIQARDPYTGKPLCLTIKEAKALYGEKWQDYLAESDHSFPMEKAVTEVLDKPWLAVEDIRTAVNSPDNMVVTSRKTNNAKRSRTNKEFVEDKEYRESKGVEFTEEGAQAALRDGEIAERTVHRQLGKATAKNIINTGHEAGVSGAQSSGITVGTMSGIMNIVAVIKGEKEADEAIADTVKDAGKAAITGYTMSSGLTVASHSLSYSKSEFIRALAKSDIPGKVITSVMVVGDTLKRYGNGEITTQECLIELGGRGLNFATMSYSMAMGQAIIPIPIVGGAIGALVGSALTSSYYYSLINSLQQREFEHQERMRIIAECRKTAEQTKAFRMELDAYLQEYFHEYQSCFDTAISSMQFSFQIGDAEGIIAGANQITAKLGGQIYYETVDEFKTFFDSTAIDII